MEDVTAYVLGFLRDQGRDINKEFVMNRTKIHVVNGRIKEIGKRNIVLSKISALLAESGIGIFVISTYNTDYIFTKKEFFKVLDVLSNIGYTVIQFMNFMYTGGYP